MSIEKSIKIFSDKKTNDNEKISNCKYRDKSYFSTRHVKLKPKCLSFFQLNVNSHPKDFDKSFHFADDTCLLNIQNKICKLNGSLNMDLD